MYVRITVAPIGAGGGGGSVPPPILKKIKFKYIDR